MNIGDKIKEERLKKEWTQEQLAQLLNVSRSTVSSWEVGRNYPDLETIVAISDLFGLPLDKLLREDREMTKEITKKANMGGVYKKLLKILLSVIAVAALAYLGMNLKLRSDEGRYRGNLQADGWENITTMNDRNQPNYNSYELKKDGIYYWTYIMETGMLGIPLQEFYPNVIARKDHFTVYVKKDHDYEIIVSPKADKNIDFEAGVKVDKNGKMIERKKSWSDEKVKAINDYLNNHQKIHQELLKKAEEKRQMILK